jgi:branched-chain amino acid transport system ATP-binding protein
LIRRRVDHIITLFPSLQPHLDQKAGTLSGGQKQLLALGTAMILAPRLLFLDEPSLGLAPSLVAKVLEHVQELCRESGIAALIVEQKVREVLKIADRAFVLRNGKVSFSGSPEPLKDDMKLKDVYL